MDRFSHISLEEHLTERNTFVIMMTMMMMMTSIMIMMVAFLFYIFSQEEFCDHVKEQYNRVYCQQNAVSDESSLTVKKKIADVVQQLKKTTFFL